MLYRKILNSVSIICLLLMQSESVSNSPIGNSEEGESLPEVNPKEPPKLYQIESLNHTESDTRKSLLNFGNWPPMFVSSISEELPDVNQMYKYILDSKDSYENQSVSFQQLSSESQDLELDEDSVTEASTISVQKCCAIGEQLLRDKTCIPLYMETSPATETYYSEPDSRKAIPEGSDWFPTNSRVFYSNNSNRSLNQVSFNYIQKKPEGSFCDIRLVNRLIFLERGDLFIENHNGIPINVSSQNFCVDRIYIDDHIEGISRSDVKKTIFHAIVLCPCTQEQSQNILCINKCCDIDDVLELGDKMRCKRETAAKEKFFSALTKIIAVNPSNETEYQLYLRDNQNPECKDGLYILNSRKNKDDATKTRFGVTQSGQIRLHDVDAYIDSEEYCIDVVNLKGHDVSELDVISCRVDYLSRKPWYQVQLYRIYYAIGAFFLGLTILVHLLIPELRKSLHSYNFIAHNFNLFVAYLILTSAHFTPLPFDPIACRLIGFAIQFFFLSTFFWLSVMCFDISSAFGGFVAKSHAHATMKFIKYAFIAWGLAAMVCLATALAEYTPIIPANSSFKPNIGKYSCWFKDDRAIGLFFYGPIGILLILNLIQYMTTVWRITAARRDTKVLRNSPQKGLSASTRAEKHWFLLYGKLFCLMGGTWVFEVVSWAFGGPSYLWYLPDGINAFRGACIFFIFLWQKKFFCDLSWSNYSGRQSSSNQQANGASQRRRERNSVSNVRTSSFQLSLVSGLNKQKVSSINNNKDDQSL